LILGAHEKLKAENIAAEKPMAANLNADRGETDFDSHVGSLLELIPVAVYVIDLNYRIQLWNRAAERVYGWSCDEIIGHEPRFIPDSQYEAGRNIWQRACQGHHIHDYETTRLRKSGQTVQISASSSRLNDRSGQLIGIVITAVDITDHASVALLLGNRVSFMQKIIESIPNAVYFKDLEGRYLGFNAAYEKLFSVDRANSLGKTLKDLFSTERAEFRGSRDLDLFKGQSSIKFDDFVDHNNQRLTLQHHKALYYGENNEPAGIVGVVTDTTQLSSMFEKNSIIEERLGLALQGSNLGMWDFNFATGLFTIDERLQEWSGSEKSTLTTELAMTQYFIVDRDGLYQQVIRLFKSEIEFLEIKVWVTSRIGESRIVEFKGRITQRSPEGRAIRCTGMATDCTDEIARVKQERLREQQLTIISENIDELMLMVDMKGYFVYRSSSATRWMDAEQASAKVRFEAYVHSQDLESYQAAFLSVVSGSNEAAARVRLHSANFGYRTVDLNLKRIQGEDGHTGWIAIVGRDVTDRIELDLRLERLAHYDQLTGVANRVLLRDRAEQAINRARRFKQLVGVVFIDLDDFKRVNDSYGHAGGDELLKAVSLRLKDVLRATDTVARQGGDEFILLLENLQSVDQARQACERVLKQFESSISIGAHQVDVGASIGVALFPDDGQNIDELFGQADAAMYQAKAGGKKRLAYFTSAIRDASVKRSKIEAALVTAIAEEQFSLVYQPQMDLLTGKIIGAEALLRWTHPEFGSVSPLDFIPIAEDSGVILAIGDWVLEQACQQVAKWHALGYPDFRIAVNVSGRQWVQSDFGLKVAQVLGSSGLQAHQLELELTESVMMKDLDSSMVTMNWLKSIGVTFALDDFGTGYSSLSYLKRFEIDIVKIDRSFTQDLPGDPHDVAIVKAILAMASGLGIQVTAEGIETQEQLEFLKSYGCEFGQGYFIARPLTPADFESQFLTPSVAINPSKTDLSICH
jgi:diguanylate cyclase (GGDEF)-like protein/PAS domain S-box-containing protein